MKGRRFLSMASRGSDASQRQSPRVPLHLKSTARSEANAVRRPAGKERSPKASPRGGVLQERKRGTELVDLESRLSKVQEELKKLRNRLASAEVAKLEAEEALVRAKKRIPAAPPAPEESGEEDEDKRERESKSEGEAVTSPETMDVFEVVIPAESVPEEMKTMVAKEAVGEDGKGDTSVEDLKAKLLEKEKEAEILLEENMIFKAHAAEKAKRIASAAEAKETELLAKLSSMEEEMQESEARARRLAELLEAAEGAKSALEEEMKRLRAQTEQWRKAAEAAAAAVLADDDDEVDKHIAAWASPLAMEEGDWKRRKGAGIRMFGELWKKKKKKKKGQQK
ncbi:interactor of constitutive active ROPs 4-like isoform X2 [Zingiber officinale]|uniref:Interactor of constitutive active ROPs 1 n=1 Tax=Zingiber officinale TaxID=94328 RepID=A0A8J5GCL3_ZINOF|nr:interactor of constitutive active ROPs 4-like isoform X2 [Zingiber officinale]KAG6505901.1 hypothetical protein ZIOFF_031214 [Zingiber officinale]